MRVRLLALLPVLGLLVALPTGGMGQPSDTISLIKDDLSPSNSDIARAIAEETFTEPVARVLVSRDDHYADALSSGVLQADAPLFLVPSEGPVPQAVLDDFESLQASEAIVLGGEVAVSPAVEAQLEGRGITVQRRQGASRFETAIDVAASDAPAARTAMLARAFPAPGASPTQAFADTLAAGGVSARTGYPILLTGTAELNQATADYIARSAIEEVLILGGTAAISDEVEDALRALGVRTQRIAGASRAETAIEIAKVAGDEDASDALRVIVTDGQGDNAWAAGFALASHAAKFDAPIVLTLGDSVPPATEAFLAPGIGADPSAAPVLTCAVVPSLCETVRVTAQLPPQPGFVDGDLWAIAGPYTPEGEYASADNVLRLRQDGTTRWTNQLNPDHHEGGSQAYHSRPSWTADGSRWAASFFASFDHPGGVLIADGTTGEHTGQLLPFSSYGDPATHPTDTSRVAYRDFDLLYAGPLEHQPDDPPIHRSEDVIFKVAWNDRDQVLFLTQSFNSEQSQFDGATGTVWRINADGTGLTRLVDGDVSQLEVSDDGTHMLTISASRRTATVMRTDASSPRGYDVGGPILDGDVGGDGGAVLVARTDPQGDGPRQLLLVTHERVLPVDDVGGLPDRPSMSPTGARVVYTTNGTTQHNQPGDSIQVLEIATGVRSTLGTAAGYYRDVGWVSPN